jgi:hypothetical protein
MHLQGFQLLAWKVSYSNTGIGGPNMKTSPNNDPTLDAIISVIAHELSEAVSDPYPDTLMRSWDDYDGLENADKCSVINFNRSILMAMYIKLRMALLRIKMLGITII